MKPSAYRSMTLGKEKKTQSTPQKKASLLRWEEEKWLNLTPRILNDNKKYPCGTKSQKQKELKLPSVCRPSVKVSEKTPMVAKSFSKEQVKKAVKIKKEGKVIKWKAL